MRREVRVDFILLAVVVIAMLLSIYLSWSSSQYYMAAVDVYKQRCMAGAGGLVWPT